MLTLNIQANSYNELVYRAAVELGLEFQQDGVLIYKPPSLAVTVTNQALTYAQRWALGPNGETMFDGKQFDTELADKYRIIGSLVFMHGKDGIWRRAAAKTWVKATADEIAKNELDATPTDPV